MTESVRNRAAGAATDLQVKLASYPAGGSRVRVLKQSIELEVASHCYKLASAGYGFVVYARAPFWSACPPQSPCPRCPWLRASRRSGRSRACSSTESTCSTTAVRLPGERALLRWISKKIWPLVNKAGKNGLLFGRQKCLAFAGRLQLRTRTRGKVPQPAPPAYLSSLRVGSSRHCPALVHGSSLST